MARHVDYMVCHFDEFNWHKGRILYQGGEGSTESVRCPILHLFQGSVAPLIPYNFTICIKQWYFLSLSDWQSVLSSVIAC